MTAHVHQHAAARLIDIPEPVAMRTGMLLELLQQVDVTYGAFLGEMPDTLVLRREAQFLGVHQLAAMLAAHRNHVVRFFERYRQRFLDDDVLAGTGGGDRRAVMKEVGQADVDNLAIGLGNQLIDVGVPLRNLPVFGDALGVFGSPREHGGYLRLRHKPGERLQMNVSDKSGTENGDLGWRHARDLPGRVYLTVRGQAPPGRSAP